MSLDLLSINSSSKDFPSSAKPLTCATLKCYLDGTGNVKKESLLKEKEEGFRMISKARVQVSFMIWANEGQNGNMQFGGGGVGARGARVSLGGKSKPGGQVLPQPLKETLHFIKAQEGNDYLPSTKYIFRKNLQVGIICYH